MRRQDASRSLTVTGETPAPSRLKKMRAVLAWGKANSLASSMAIRLWTRSPVGRWPLRIGARSLTDDTNRVPWFLFRVGLILANSPSTPDRVTSVVGWTKWPCGGRSHG